MLNRVIRLSWLCDCRQVTQPFQTLIFPSLNEEIWTKLPLRSYRDLISHYHIDNFLFTPFLSFFLSLSLSFFGLVGSNTESMRLPCDKWYRTSFVIASRLREIWVCALQRVHAKSLQLFPTLCDPVDCSWSVSSVHGVLQASMLEWIAMPSSRGSFRPRDWSRLFSVSCTGRWVLYH